MLLLKLKIQFRGHTWLVTSHNDLTPVSNYYGTKTRVKFNGSCLQQPKLSYTYGKIVKIYIVYERSASSSRSDDPTLENCLFSAVTLTKIDDIDKYGYSGYGIGIDRKWSFHLQVANLVKM